MIAQQSTQVLNFTANEKLYCTTLDSVERVIQLLSLQSVPGMPCYHKGIMDMHGDKLPVIDLAELLETGNQHSKDYNLDTPIIVCEHALHKCGVIVDKVLTVDNINLDRLHVIQKGEHSDYIKGSIQTSLGAALYLHLNDQFMDLLE